MKKLLVNLLFVLAAVAASTNTLLAQGVNFKQNTYWNEILRTAKAENKYIFVDCYATWCAPCKLMDREIYPDKSVGDYMNARFICVKVQMDKTNYDNADIKSWYDAAEMLKNHFAVDAYPCFLFFTPDGKPLHKVVGAKLPAKAFLASVEDAFNPDKQYYSILKNFQPGKLDTAEEKGLALSVGYDKPLAAKIALDYLSRVPEREYFSKDHLQFISRFSEVQQVKELMLPLFRKYTAAEFHDRNHVALLDAFKSDPRVLAIAVSYLNGLNETQLLDKDNLALLKRFQQMIEPGDRYFRLFYQEPAKADTVMKNPQFSRSMVDAVIGNKLIQPAAQIADSLQKDPDWTRLYQVVAARTDTATAGRNIRNAKTYFYRGEVQNAELGKTPNRFFWGRKLATALYEQAGTDGMIGTFKALAGINNNAFWVFAYSDDPRLLNAASDWMNIQLKKDKTPSGPDLDTQANILYKLGQKQQALQMEKQAIAADPTNKEITANFEKMREGKPTWESPVGAN